jgi:hypothetical protein
MSRLIAVSTCVLCCGIAMLPGGCRIWYELNPEELVNAGATAGQSPNDPTPQAGVGAGGTEAGAAAAAGGGGAAFGGGGGASGEPAVQGGQGGEGGEDVNLAGAGGMGAGGESPVGSLPPLPCAEPLVWSTDFSSDPTVLDDNGDAQPDWVIRGGQSFVTAELESGVWRPTTSKALDTFPPVNFTGRTQARVRMRDTNQTAPSVPSSFAGALFWINLDYQPSDFLAVFSSITTLDGSSYELGVFARAGGSTQTLAGPLGVPMDAFIVLELDFDPASNTIAAWVDGTLLPMAAPSRNNVVNTDHFATVIAPQGTGEFDEIWVATCTP